MLPGKETQFWFDYLDIVKIHHNQTIKFIAEWKLN